MPLKSKFRHTKIGQNTSLGCRTMRTREFVSAYSKSSGHLWRHTDPPCRLTINWFCRKMDYIRRPGKRSCRAPGCSDRWFLRLDAGCLRFLFGDFLPYRDCQDFHKSDKQIALVITMMLPSALSVDSASASDGGPLWQARSTHGEHCIFRGCGGSNRAWLPTTQPC